MKEMDVARFGHSSRVSIGRGPLIALASTIAIIFGLHPGIYPAGVAVCGKLRCQATDIQMLGSSLHSSVLA